MFIVKFFSVVLFLIGSEGIQASKRDRCRYPYRMLGENCYYFSTDTASWDVAYINCAHKGGYLANLETLHEYLVLRYALAGMKTGEHYSIGGRDLNRQVTGGDWRWVKPSGNSKMSYFAFGPTEPTGNQGSPELCLWLYAGYQYQFIDIPCKAVGRYICEK